MKNLAKLTDEQIIVYVRTKDQESYREIIQRYQDKLLRYANYLAQDKMKAADIVQNAFIKAFINLNSFNPKKKFSPWIYRIVHNEAMNELKRYPKEIPLLHEADLKSNEVLEDNLTKKEIRLLAEKCLAKLPLPYSEPLSLFYLEEKSYNEISDILRLPIGTVGTRINRAKILMRKLCQQIQS